MKRKMTMKLPDGRTITHEMDDEGAKIHKNILQMQNQPPDAKTSYLELLKKRQGGGGSATPDMPMRQTAMMGRAGDDRLAHVNGYEDMMLRLMGGSGSMNPRTGLKEYAIFGKKNYGNEVWAEPTQQLPYKGVGTFPEAPIAPVAPPAGPTPTLTPPPGGYSVSGAPAGTQPTVYNQGSVANAPMPVQAVAPNTVEPESVVNLSPNSQGTWEQRAEPTNTGNTVNLDPNLKPFSISGSQSSSGLPDTYRDRLLKTLFPQLESSITDMDANYDLYTNQALGSYQQMMQNALRKNIPAAIANLANRGIINSTEGQKVLGNVYSSAAEDAANKGYQTAMQSAFLKANAPTVLSQIAQLGQGTRSNQFSYQEDPTVMQRSLIDLLRSMQG